MRAFITGAGQVARGLINELTRTDEAVVLRRSNEPIPTARVTPGDAADRASLRALAAHSDAIFHCVHASYDPRAWRRELPEREQAVMDVAYELGKPVVFPESVYAFGRSAESLFEGAPLDPCSPLGEVRAEMLSARRAHPATTISIVAGDLIGPTATIKGSVPKATIIDPIVAGRTAWVLGDPDAPHSMTRIPDLARAMLTASSRADALAPGGDAVLHAPTPPAVSQRRFAQQQADELRLASTRVRAIPNWALLPLVPFSPTTRSLRRQMYLWDYPMVLHPGVLTENAISEGPAQ
ncbi:NAD-dependent epimerase/dehydratase family protein [Dermacoccus abyssi]